MIYLLISTHFGKFSFILFLSIFQKINLLSPHVTFPSPITMQVDFPSNRYTSSRRLNPNTENRRIPIQQISINSISSPTYKFRQRSSLQSYNELEHHRSSSPALSDIIEEDIDRSITSNTDSSNESSIFPQEFNSNIFYRSIFQPKIFTDDRNQRYIEMKLDVHDYNPDDIKVSINDNDLIVQIKNSNFYKQITLPSNIDLTSLSLHHHYDKKLYIKIKLLDEYSSFKYI